MARIVITAPADTDVERMLADLKAEAGVLTAARYERRLLRLLDQLADYPESGHPRPRLGSHMRMTVLLPYLVFYRHTPGDDVVSIVRVIHGHRRITRHDLPRFDT